MNVFNNIRINNIANISIYLLNERMCNNKIIIVL